MFKMTRIAAKVAVLASSLACVSLASAAEDVMFSTGGYARGGEGLRTMKVMKAIDKDSDKMVSKEEFITMHEATFDKMDKNQDGMLSAEEWAGKQRKSDSRPTNKKESITGREGAATKEGAASKERPATKADEAPNKNDRKGSMDDSVPGNKDLLGPTR